MSREFDIETSTEDCQSGNTSKHKIMNAYHNQRDLFLPQDLALVPPSQREGQGTHTCTGPWWIACLCPWRRQKPVKQQFLKQLSYYFEI